MNGFDTEIQLSCMKLLCVLIDNEILSNYHVYILLVQITAPKPSLTYYFLITFMYLNVPFFISSNCTFMWCLAPIYHNDFSKKKILGQRWSDSTNVWYWGMIRIASSYKNVLIRLNCYSSFFLGIGTFKSLNIRWRNNKSANRYKSILTINRFFSFKIWWDMCAFD